MRRDRKERRAEKRAKAAERERVRLVQEEIPLKGVAGGVAHLKDGSYRVYVEYPGSNHSLFTDDEKEDEAWANTEVLSSVSTQFAILKYPRLISAHDRLVSIDEAIAEATEAAYGDWETTGRPGAMRRVELLSERMRPDALRAASEGARIEWTSVVVFCYPPRYPQATALREVDVFCRLVEDKTKLAPHVLSTTDVLELAQMWLTPSNVNPDRPVYMTVPLPQRRR